MIAFASAWSAMNFAASAVTAASDIRGSRIMPASNFMLSSSVAGVALGRSSWYAVCVGVVWAASSQVSSRLGTQVGNVAAMQELSVAFGATHAEVQHTLTAQQLRHYPDDDSTELDQPLLLYRGKQSPTRISADRAQLLKDGKEAILRDNVRVLREASPGNPEMTLETSVLNVYPDDEIARTDKPVKLTQGKSVAHGVGMVADRVKQTYILESRVKATLERTRRP